MMKNIRDIFHDGKFTARSVILSIALCGALFLSGWCGGIYWYQTVHESARRSQLRLYKDASQNHFTNPLLACYSAADSIADTELRPFEHLVKQLIDDRVKKKYVDDVAMKFQDLNKGLTFGINDNDKFIPASLWKVPIMIAYFKRAETDPGILTKRLKYENMADMDLTQNFKPLKKLEYGKAYTVDELIYRSIVYSDNNAYQLLLNNIPLAAMSTMVRDLGFMPPWLKNDPHSQLNINEYSSFFRILYNASYLTREYSEKALKLMSEVDFPDGIVAGLPKKVLTAQKFGERTSGGNNEVKQLHDCGIVYYPGHPYLLCIMTKGRSFDDLADTIKNISRAIYEEIDRQHP